ncbi:MAG TPA: nitroreductase, partial [Candidatus Merdenecus merdavium]|nr:nitroreductase [Candidatus Merdenecus merdavium]
MNLYETIFVRRSVRSYSMEPLENKTMNEIMKFQKELIPLFPDIVTKIEVINALEKPGQIKGLFKVKAPYY